MERIPNDPKYSPKYIDSSNKSSEEDSLDKIFEDNYNRRINFVNSENRPTPTSREKISSSSEQQLEQKKQHQLNILNDYELTILQKVEEKLGRPLDDLEKTDTIDYIIYEPDRVRDWLEEDTEPTENIAVETQPIETEPTENIAIETEPTETEPTENIAIETQPIETEPTENIAIETQLTVKEKTQLNLSKKVINMSSLEKITKTIEQAIFYLPKEKGNKLKTLLSSNTLTGLVAFMSAWSVSQFIGIGAIIDLGVVFLGGTFLGWKAIAIFKDSLGFANSINATTEEDLDVAAQHLVKIVLTIEIDSLLTLFAKKDSLK